MSKNGGFDVVKGNVIINGDDFGLTESCTRAIYDSYIKGYISSTSMVANGEALEYAKTIIENDFGFSTCIGIHLNLTEGRPLTDRIKNNRLFVNDGVFTNYIIKNPKYILSDTDKEVVFEEFDAQIKKIKEFVKTPNHLDTHQHIHMNPRLIHIIVDVCKTNNIKVIRNRKTVNLPEISKTGIINKYYRLYYLLSGLKTTNHFANIGELNRINSKKLYEIMVHPDYDKAGKLINRSTGTIREPIGEELEKEIHRVHLDNSNFISFNELMNNRRNSK